MDVVIDSSVLVGLLVPNDLWYTQAVALWSAIKTAGHTGLFLDCVAKYGGDRKVIMFHTAKLLYKGIKAFAEVRELLQNHYKGPEHVRITLKRLEELLEDPERRAVYHATPCWYMRHRPQAYLDLAATAISEDRALVESPPEVEARDEPECKKARRLEPEAHTCEPIEP